MTNIRKLKFSYDVVNENHWQAIVALGSLEELCFDGCTFAQLEHLEYGVPKQSIELPIHHLQVTGCLGDFRSVAAIDAPFLRGVATNDCIVNDINWLPCSAFTELSLELYCSRNPYFDEDGWATHIVFELVPQTVEVLSLTIGIDEDDCDSQYPSHDAESFLELLEDIFTAPAWGGSLHLCSLTLQFERTFSTLDSDVFRIVLDGISRLTHLKSCVLRDHENSCEGIPKMLPSELQAALHKKIGPHSCLTHVDCFGIILHLVEGEWVITWCS